MSNKGYINEKRRNQFAKILDGLVDFNKVFKDKKLFGIFPISNFMEKNDRRFFKYMITILDDELLGNSYKPEVSMEIDKALSFLEEKDFEGFDNYIAGVLSNAVETPFGVYEKQIFVSVLMMLNGLIGKAIAFLEKKIAIADAEDAAQIE